jgi:hypothetical protein
MARHKATVSLSLSNIRSNDDTTPIKRSGPEQGKPEWKKVAENINIYIFIYIYCNDSYQIPSLDFILGTLKNIEHQSSKFLYRIPLVF